MKRILTLGILALMLFVIITPSTVEAASKSIGGKAEAYKVAWGGGNRWYDCGIDGYKYHEVTYGAYFKSMGSYDQLVAKGENLSCEYDAKHEKRTFRAESTNGAGKHKNGMFRRWGNESDASQPAARGFDYYGGQQGTWS